MSKHGARLSKGLGQNFIVDPDVCPEIAHISGADKNTGVIEIGPGIGVLTAQLAKRCKKILAIEIDKTLLPVLGETLAEFDNISVLNADVLKTDLSSLIAEHFADMDVIVCANLPYYITSPIVMYLLESKLPIRSITVMVQKEAAQRICAPMPSRASGAITAAVRYHSNPSLLMDVPREAFLPPPNVDSAVIQLDILTEPPIPVLDETRFFKVVAASFSQRRKTLVNTLASSLGRNKAEIAEILNTVNIPQTARAEELSMEDFGRLAERLLQLR